MLGSWSGENPVLALLVHPSMSIVHMLVLFKMKQRNACVLKLRGSGGIISSPGITGSLHFCFMSQNDFFCAVKRIPKHVVYISGNAAPDLCRGGRLDRLWHPKQIRRTPQENLSQLTYITSCAPSCRLAISQTTPRRASPTFESVSRKNSKG